MEQIVDLCARGRARGGEQVGCGACLREPAARSLLHKAKDGKYVQPGKQNHRQCGRQVPDAGQRLKRKLEQKAGHDAEIDVISSVIVGHIPQGIGRGGLPGGGVVGVFQFSHGGGRVLFKVKAAIQQTVRQRTVLGTGVGRPVVDVHGEVDAARTRPVGGVIKARGDTRVEAVPEGRQKRRRAERQPHGQHCRAVFFLMGQVGVLPRGTGRAQGERRQCQCEDDRKAQDGEIQRAAGVGVNRGQLGIERVAAVLAGIARRRQRQGGRPAGEVKAVGPAAGGRGGDLPVPALAGGRAGLVGSGDVEGQQNVLLLRRVAVGQRGQAVELQIVYCKIEARKFQRCLLIVQRQRRGGVCVIDQIRAQVNRRVAVGRQPVQVADE